MGLELEHDVGDTKEKKQGGSSTGENEKTGFAELLDGTRLAGLRGGVENNIIDALEHEIGDRNDERFCRTSKLSKGLETG